MRPWWLAPAQERGKKNCDTPEGCWNCGKKGHYKDKHPELAAETAKPTKETKKEVALKKIESVNTVESDSESDAVFLVTYDSDFDESDDLGDGDWFDEIVMLDSKEKDWFSEGKVDESIDSAHDVHSPNDLSLSDTSDIVQTATELASSDNRRDNGV